MENTQEKTPSFFRFEDLRVYDKAIDFNCWLLNNLPSQLSDAQQPFANAFCRSANDIALNIAEGSAQPKSQFDHYLKISKTALRECVVYTHIAKQTGIFTEEQSNQARETLMELTRMLGALIISVTRGHQRRENVELTKDDDLEEMNELKF